jgi:3-hydroxymyristoyl/3-hydroxydecanoyl-(acyl carrier protein) dehydratase
MVDRIEELRRFDYAVGVKAISLSEDCFEHHFPGQPVYPGALLIESMAQLGGALLEISLREELDHCPRCVMSTVKAKFRDFVRPGDRITFRAEVLGRHDDDARVRVVGTRGATSDKPVCEAELLYLLLRIDDPALEASRNQFLDTITLGTRFV